MKTKLLEMVSENRRRGDEDEMGEKRRLFC